AISTLSLHDALPISFQSLLCDLHVPSADGPMGVAGFRLQTEEPTEVAALRSALIVHGEMELGCLGEVLRLDPSALTNRAVSRTRRCHRRPPRSEERRAGER